MNSVRLFVYGSLKRGGLHHVELADSRFVAETGTAPGYAVVQQGAYLALVEAPGSASTVRGELFEVPVAKLPALDEFEGEGYRRGEVLLQCESGENGERDGEWGSALAYFRKSR